MTQALRVLEPAAGSRDRQRQGEDPHHRGHDLRAPAWSWARACPADVLAACKECNVLIKGPFTTPRAGDKFPDGTPMPNMVSANSLLRRSLDLFAAVRPIKIPEKNIDWCFFRENIEGEYIWGNKGIQVNDDLAIDFKVQTRQGSERIARAAFEYARKNGKHNVTAITKANIVKLADGNFLKAVHHIGETEYPDIEVQERLVDAMTAKMQTPSSPRAAKSLSCRTSMATS